jgi:hypothetical protein
MNDFWANNYWDDYIQNKFSNRGRIKNLRITKLYKVYSVPRCKFWGHTDKDNIAKVSYWSEDGVIKLAIGHDETYDGVDDMTVFDIYTDTATDCYILEILQERFGWIIEDYFDFCE